MAQLADLTKRMGYKLEQVQDFTPTPMTVATETWYTGYDPYTLEPVFSAKTQKEKLAQRQYFFWYKDEEQQQQQPHHGRQHQSVPHHDRRNGGTYNARDSRRPYEPQGKRDNNRKRDTKTNYYHTKKQKR